MGPERFYLKSVHVLLLFIISISLMWAHEEITNNTELHTFNLKREFMVGMQVSDGFELTGLYSIIQFTIYRNYHHKVIEKKAKKNKKPLYRDICPN